MIISKTPYRVSLFGGSTDFESYYSEFESLLIGFTINKHCYIACRKTPGILPHFSSINYAITERVDDNKDIKHDGVRGTLDFLKIDYGVEISYMGDLPARTGTGSSSSFVVGLLHALNTLNGFDCENTKKNLANDAIYIERKLLKEPGGIQDQIWAAYGGVNSIRIDKDGRFTVRPLPVSSEFLEEFKQHIVILYTGKERQSFAIARSNDTKESKTLEFKHNIKSIAHDAYEAFNQENVEEIGKLLNKSWQEKRKISPLISGDKIDTMYDKGKLAGALGGKLLGAGGSGFFFFIVPPRKRDNFVEEMGLFELSFDFDFDGSQMIVKNGS